MYDDCTSQTVLLWTHNQRRWVPVGEVRDPGESEREAKAWKTKDVIQQSHHKMDVVGRLITTPDGTAKEKEAAPIE